MEQLKNGKTERKAESQNLTLIYSGMQAAFWVSICNSLTFAAVYLQGFDYSNTQLGMVMAAGNLLGALLGPLISSAVDRREKLTALRTIPPLAVAQLFALLVLLVSEQKSFTMSAAYALYIAFCLAVNSSILKLYVDIQHGGREIHFGTARAAGSFAYVLASALTGILVEKHSVRIIPVAGVLICTVQLLLCLQLSRMLPKGFRGKKTDPEKGDSLPDFIRQNRSFSILLVGITLMFFSHNTISNFTINIARHVGGDTTTMGWLGAFMAAVEIPVMMLYERLRGKRSNAPYLRVAVLFFVIKSAAVAMAPNVPWLYAALLLQAPSFALYSSAVVDYADEVVPFRDSAKAQSLVFSMSTLGSVLSSLIAGRLFDLTGVPATMWIVTAVCAVGSAVAWTGLKRRKQVRLQLEERV